MDELEVLKARVLPSGILFDDTRDIERPELSYRKLADLGRSGTSPTAEHHLEISQRRICR